jgi:two-component system CheB/CheR fusion protein
MKKRESPEAGEKKSVKAPKQKAAPAPRDGNLFPIAGIGASAGGLEALEHFLSNVPENTGIGYVIVQHLDPTHKGLMPELLQRHTRLKVHQVRDRMKVLPGNVYIIPPNKGMSILHGTLHLFEPTAPRGLRLPIDFFLRSLAEDLKERSMGVILSGMGTDGTMGLTAIKEKGGVVLVQDPASAKFDGMPRSAIDAGLADFVATPAELSEKLQAYVKHIPMIVRPGATLDDKAMSGLEKAMILLRTQTGHDFTPYKKSTLYRRIERRMGVHQIQKIADYIRYLQDSSQERELLFKELLIGVTNFFRDPAGWAVLKERALPELIAGYPTGRPLRAWIPGCSTGEEAYSLAIVFREVIEKMQAKENFSLQIFATDLDSGAIERARQGIYMPNIAQDVSPERLNRFFILEGEEYRVGKDIRGMVVFAQQNLIMDPPFTKLDILICRNLLIYLNQEAQKRLLPLFHYSLNPGGILFLGSAETVGTYTHLFSPLDAKTKIFHSVGTALRTEAIDFPYAPAAADADVAAVKAQKPEQNLQSAADQIILQTYAPPAVVVTGKGDVLYISGRTGKYLEPPAGKANWNIFAMAREGLRYELPGVFQKAVREKGPVTISGLKVKVNGGEQHLDLTVQPIGDKGSSLRDTVLVLFRDVEAPVLPRGRSRSRSGPASDTQIEELKKENQNSLEELRTLREEMQTSQEELKSTNEELQSTNEELQSTNEELTTSKEEMQSLNEELQTVNAELQAKVDELSRTNNDMKNLLNSTEIATLFLDNNLHIRRFTTQATSIIKLIAGDVGRPVTDIASSLDYPDLMNDAREVLRTLVFKENEIAAGKGRWFKVRIMPYRTLQNTIDGVAITFVDISQSKRLEEDLRKRIAELETELARR